MDVRDRFGAVADAGLGIVFVVVILGQVLAFADSWGGGHRRRAPGTGRAGRPPPAPERLDDSLAGIEAAGSEACRISTA